MKLVAEDIAKYFGDKKIFDQISFAVNSGSSVAITGPNGSGKTTLVKILCHLIRPSQGKVTYFIDNKALTPETVYKYVGLVGPYLELYEDLSALENLYFVAKMRKIKDVNRKIDQLMNLMNLAGRENDQVKTYSSGMRQRLKYVFALLHDPQVLILDEPTANLDIDGIRTVYEIMSKQKQNGILIMATNDQADLKFGDVTIAVVS